MCGRGRNRKNCPQLYFKFDTRKRHVPEKSGLRFLIISILHLLSILWAHSGSVAQNYSFVYTQLQFGRGRNRNNGPKSSVPQNHDLKQILTWAWYWLIGMYITSCLAKTKRLQLEQKIFLFLHEYWQSAFGKAVFEFFYG